MTGSAEEQVALFDRSGVPISVCPGLAALCSEKRGGTSVGFLQEPIITDVLLKKKQQQKTQNNNNKNDVEHWIGV